MFRKELLSIVRTGKAGSAERGLSFIDGLEEDGVILRGRARSPDGETFCVKDGYLDLLGRRSGAHNAANVTNFLPGAGRLYEPLWRRGSLTRLTGEPFPNQRELKVMSELIRLDRGGAYLDLGCSAGLYSRNLARSLGNRGDLVGVDISPRMLREAVRLARANDASPSFLRADVQSLPLADETFAGALCGGTLNELGDPEKALREAHRVLAPGARLAIMGILKAQSGWGGGLQKLLGAGGLRFFKAAEVEGMLEEAGFEPEPPRTRGPVFFAGATRP